jgi:small-conductance mechanosensitive channel
MDINEGYNLLVDKLESWLEAAVAILPNLAVALLILIAFFVIGKFVRRFVNNMLHKVTNNKTIIDLLETVSGVIVVSIGIFIALGILNLSGTVTSLLAGMGILGLALGFAFQDIAANFISGVLLTIRHPFGKGDIIESNDYYGTVHKLNLRSTIIKTPQGQFVYIPNKDVYGNPFVNFTQTAERRVDLSCGVSYGDDLEKARSIAIEAVESLNCIDKDRDVELFFDEFGGSSINFKIRFWIDFHKGTDFLKAQSEAIIAIAKKFDESDIMIPFPIRTLDFGIRGGEKLNTMLKEGDSKSNGASE